MATTLDFSNRRLVSRVSQQSMGLFAHIPSSLGNQNYKKTAVQDSGSLSDASFSGEGWIFVSHSGPSQIPYTSAGELGGGAD